MVEKLIGVFFLRKGFGQQRHDRTVPELLREIPGRGVARDLIMLYPLRGADKGEIGGRVFFLFAFLHNLLAFLDKAHHPSAGLGPGRLAEEVKAFVQTLDLRFGLRQMLLEQFAKLVEPRRFRHLGKSLGQLLLGVKDVPKLIDQQFVETFLAFCR